jgi:hypothetical protein
VASRPKDEADLADRLVVPTVSRPGGGAPSDRVELERHAVDAGESHVLDDVRLSGRENDGIGPVLDGESAHAGGAVGVVGSGQSAGHDVAELFLFDGWCSSQRYDDTTRRDVR